MSALTGRTDIEGCAAEGWPEWLAELGTVVFDNSLEDEALKRAVGFAEAVKAAEERGADWDEVFRAFRLDSVLPIALESIGEGDEKWRVDCRRVVEKSIARGGVAADAADAVEAAEAAWAAWAVGAAGAAEAARAAGAAGAAWAAWAAWAVGAAEAAWAAWAARADAHTRIYKSICKVLRGEKGAGA